MCTVCRNIMSNPIEPDDFLKVEMHVGTVISAEPNRKSRKPAWVMEIDFGGDMGIRKTSAQVTDLYAQDALPGMQVVAVTNFAPLRVGGVKSEVLVLGVVEEAGVVLLTPDRKVRNGLRIA